MNSPIFMLLLGVIGLLQSPIGIVGQSEENSDGTKSTIESMETTTEPPFEPPYTSPPDSPVAAGMEDGTASTADMGETTAMPTTIWSTTGAETTWTEAGQTTVNPSTMSPTSSTPAESLDSGLSTTMFPTTLMQSTSIPDIPTDPSSTFPPTTMLVQSTPIPEMSTDSISSTDPPISIPHIPSGIFIPDAESSMNLIEKLSLNYYKRKTGAILTFLNELIPTMNELRQNMSTLLDEESNPQVKMSLQDFKQADQFLEHNLDEIEMDIEGKQQRREALASIVNQTETHLWKFHSDFENILKGDQLGKASQCGGFLNVTTETTTFTYIRRQGYSESDLRQETCIWVIASGKSDIFKITTKVMKFNLGAAGEENVLSIHKRSDDDSNLVGQIVRPADEALTSFEHNNHLIVVFSTVNSKGSPHFELEIGLHSGGTYANVSIQHLPSSDFQDQLDYPGNGQHYRDNERTYFILNPLPNHKIYTSFSKINTEQTHDHVAVESYRQDGSFHQLIKYTGSYGSAGSYEGQLDMPVIISFKSDGSQTNTGFTMTYNLNYI